MSLVGTRPPTMDEWEKYELHHRKRLAIKPGLTGMWQVSGRSDITDFEEVVELDTKYIAEWCLKLDIEILVTHTLGYTVMNSAYLAGRGTGSSYIAELYQDFGYTGIILGNILYSFLLARITKNEDNDSLLKKSIKFMIITQLLWAPRGSFTYFISQNLTPTTIATLLLVFGISYLWEKRKYARKRKYS